MSTPSTSPAHLAESVRQAYSAGLNPQGGFLPPVLPPTSLPGPLARYVELCRDLPRHYHGHDAHVRPWLEEYFADFSDDLLPLVDELDEPHQHLMMTVLATMAHAYRWNSAPPRAVERNRPSIDLPAGIVAPWRRLATRLDMPCVGGMYHLVLVNWRLKSRPDGGDYVNSELVGDDLDVAFHYLLPPSDREARTLFISLVESEARGASALRTIVALLAAAAREEMHETTYLLDKLRTEIAAITNIFATTIRKQNLKSDTFLTLIQPTHVWGLPEPQLPTASAETNNNSPVGTQPLDGASGSQAPILQALDAVLGLQRRSHTGHLILKGRAYLLPAHRKFLDALDAASSVVRGFVERTAWPPMTELFNGCVQGLQFWRKMHQKRGALYLKGETVEAAAQYASVGGTVDTQESPNAGTKIREFEDAMQQRLDETTAALFALDAPTTQTIHSTFMFLTPTERDLLVEGATSRDYEADKTVLEQGARRQGIFIIRKGAVRVAPEAAPDRIVAYLEEGELFGEMSFLENEGASYEVVADVPSRVDVIEREHVYKLLGEVPGFSGRFYQSLAALLSRRLRRTNALLEAAMHVRERIDGTDTAIS